MGGKNIFVITNYDKAYLQYNFEHSSAFLTLSLDKTLSTTKYGFK